MAVARRKLSEGPTTINPHTGERIPAYLVSGANPYTNNLNDPFEQAQHNFAGPGPAALTAALRRQGMTFGNLAPSSGRSLASGGSDDAARSGVINAYLGELADENAQRPANAPLDAVEAELRAIRDKQTVTRAAATANAPGVSARGREILPKNAKGIYETAELTGQEPPVNRQALAAQMAPGLIAPPAAAPPVTFGAPVKATVNGKQVFVRPGSDGQTYDMGRKAIPAESIEQDALPIAGKKPLTQTAEASMIAKLAADWNKANQTSSEMERQFQIMKAGIDRFDADPNSASQAVLVTFQKMLDPESVVRESEYARSSQGISALNRIKGYMERLASGGAGVPKAQLEEMVKTAQRFKENTKDAPAGARKRISATADRYEIPHELIFSDRPDAGGGGKVTVTDPGGGVHDFETQAQADAFKKLAGIK